MVAASAHGRPHGEATPTLPPLPFADRELIAELVVGVLYRHPTLRGDDPEPVHSVARTDSVRVHLRWRHRRNNGEQPGWIEIDTAGKPDFRHLDDEAAGQLRLEIERALHKSGK